MHQRSLPQREKGVALITAILIVALASIIASGMMASQNVGIHRSGNLFLGEQALWYSLGAENWATQVLRRDREDNEIDHYDEPWAQTMDYLPVEGGFLSGALIDLQSRFNLNNLVGSKPDRAAAQFERLLSFIEGVDPYAVQVIVQSARDWVDADIEPRFPEGAEDDYYLGLTPAYRSANRPFTSVSELLLVRGITPDMYRLIAPFVAALPPDTPINVNTASPEVLASLSADISRQDIEQLIAKREDNAYENPQDFLAEPAFAGREIDTDIVSTDTAHFLLQAQAIVGTTRVTLYSLLFRDQKGRTKALIRSKDLI